MIAELQSVCCDELPKHLHNRRIGQRTPCLRSRLKHYGLIDKAGTRERSPGHRASLNQQAGDALGNERFHNSWKPKLAGYLGNAEDACPGAL